MCAPILVRAGASWLGVTCAAEGGSSAGCARGRRSVRRHPHHVRVYAGRCCGDYRLQPGAGDLDRGACSVAGWNGRPHAPGGRYRDGAGRGVARDEPLDRLLALVAGSALKLDGFFTHFCSSEEANSSLTSLQELRFEQAVTQLRASGLSPTWLHAGNSSTVDNPTQPGGWLVSLAGSVNAVAMVRSGLAMFGYCLPISSKPEGTAEAHVRAQLLPVMTWRASILATRSLEAGDTVGYNATFTADRPMRVALLAVGVCGWAAAGAERTARVGDRERPEVRDSGAGFDEPDGGGCDRG